MVTMKRKETAAAEALIDCIDGDIIAEIVRLSLLHNLAYIDTDNGSIHEEDIEYDNHLRQPLVSVINHYSNAEDKIK